MALRSQQAHRTFELFGVMGTGLEEPLGEGHNRVNAQTPAVCALSAVEQRQIKEWQLHVSNGHKPFRRDCAVCVEGAGRDRPRRRLQHPESYTLSIHLSRPHKKGIDQRGRPSYFMVAVYTVPVQDSFSLPFFFRPTPSWLPPGRSTCLRACCKWD